MLILRDRQLRVLARAALVRWLIDHLRKFFPDRCDELGKPKLRDEIRYGMERATSFGFTSPDHLSQYLDLMFTLGRDFDRDPGMPWAAAILADRSLDAAARMKKLCETALRELGVDASLDEEG